MRYLTLTISITLSALSAHSIAGQTNAIDNKITSSQIEQAQELIFDNARKEVTPSQPETLMRVADMYRMGLGTQQNTKEAFKYYNEASKLRYGPAQERIAQFYLSGDGIKQDKVKGMQWLHKAAENGSYEAMVQLSIRYKIGNGVKQSDFNYELWQSRANTMMKKNQQQQSLAPPARQPRTTAAAPAPIISPNITTKKPRSNDYGLDRL